MVLLNNCFVDSGIYCELYTRYFFPKAILVEQRENMKSCDNGMLKYEKNTKEDQEKMSKSFSVSARTPAGRNDTQKRSN